MNGKTVITFDEALKEAEEGSIVLHVGTPDEDKFVVIPKDDEANKQYQKEYESFRNQPYYGVLALGILLVLGILVYLKVIGVV